MLDDKHVPLAIQTISGRQDAPADYQPLIVEHETAWRQPSLALKRGAPSSSICASRWCAVTDTVREATANTSEEYYVAKIVLRNMDIRFSSDGRSVQDGIATPGSIHVANPSADVSCLFRGSYDCLHLHIPRKLMADCSCLETTTRFLEFEYPNKFAHDSTVGQLCRALISAGEIGAVLGPLYGEYLTLALVTKIIALFQCDSRCSPAKVPGLAKWRLKRAMDYIDARFADPIRLADIAAAAGLTRMYFAAQFRESTGLRPHEYLLRRRIERAQKMLSNKSTTLVDVALSVGFESQSHYTTVFKRFVGQPPNVWRQSIGSEFQQDQHCT
jgi:AraC family transcriptional regulator